MLAEISAGLASLKSATDMAKALSEANTQAKINDIKIELHQKIFDAQGALNAAQDAYSSSSAQISQLQAEIERLKAWDGEKQRYQLKRFYPGTLAYSLKAERSDGEPPHNLCASCYQRGVKSILQATTELKHRYRIQECGACRAHVPLGPECLKPRRPRRFHKDRPGKCARSPLTTLGTFTTRAEKAC